MCYVEREVYPYNMHPKFDDKNRNRLGNIPFTGKMLSTELRRIRDPATNFLSHYHNLRWASDSRAGHTDCCLFHYIVYCNRKNEYAQRTRSRPKYEERKRISYYPTHGIQFDYTKIYLNHSELLLSSSAWAENGMLIIVHGSLPYHLVSVVWVQTTKSQNIYLS